MIQIRRHLRQRITGQRRRALAAARCEHISQVRRQAFVHPQQVGLHRLFEIGCRQIRRTPVLSVPRMHVLVRQKPGGQFPSVLFHQRPLFDPAVIRFVMLQSEMRDVIAQGQQEVVVGVVPRAKQNSRLLHQVPIMFPDFFRSIERGGAVGCKIEFRGRIFGAERHHLQILARDDRTIHQHGQRNGRKMNVAARLIGNMQRRPKLPSRGQPQARAIRKLIGTVAGGIEQQRVPVDDVQLFRRGQSGAVSRLKRRG